MADARITSHTTINLDSLQQRFEALRAGFASLGPVAERAARQFTDALPERPGPDAFRCDGTGEPWTP